MFFKPIAIEEIEIFMISSIVANLQKLSLLQNLSTNRNLGK